MLREYKNLFRKIPKQPVDKIFNLARSVISTCSSGKLDYQHDDLLKETFAALSDSLDVAINKQKSLIILSFWRG